MSDKISGSCLCGKVKFEIENHFDRFFLCHCAQCQKTSGSVHVSNLFGSADGFRWMAGEKLVKRFEYPNRDFTNAFCTECGSGVPYLNQSRTAIVVPAGTLDAEPNFSSASKIFYSERAKWTSEIQSMEAFEKFPTV